MRVPITTVKGWLHKSRTRLRRTFADSADGATGGAGTSASAGRPRFSARPSRQSQRAFVVRAALRAQATLALAVDEALLLGHPYLGVEHLLLAMLRQGSGPGYD